MSGPRKQIVIGHAGGKKKSKVPARDSELGLSRTFPGDGSHPELLLGILSLLKPSDVIHCSAVCKAWHNILQKCPSLWKNVRDQQRKQIAQLGDLAGQVPSSKDCGERKGVEARGMEEQQTCLIQEALDCEQRVRFASFPPEVVAWRAHKKRATTCVYRNGIIVSGGDDEAVRVWQACTRKLLMELRCPQDLHLPITAVDFDDSMVMAAVGSEILVWNRHEGRLVRRIGKHFQHIRAMRFVETEVVAACADGSVRIFDAYSSTCSQILRPHSRAVTAVDYHPGGGEGRESNNMPVILSGSSDGSVSVFDVSASCSLLKLRSPNPSEGITCVKISPCGNIFFAGTSRGALHRWDIRQLNFARMVHITEDMSALTSIDFSSHAPSTMIAASVNGKGYVIDASVGRLINMRDLSPTLEHTPESTVCPNSDGTQPKMKTLGQNSSKNPGLVPSRRSESDSLHLARVRNRIPVTCVSVNGGRVVSSHADGVLRSWYLG